MESASAWPGREAQIEQLMGLLEDPDLGTPVFVHGPAATGKTGVLKFVLKRLRIRHALVDCLAHSTPRLLFEEALDQFYSHRPRMTNGYTSWSPCDSPAAFVAGLQGVLAEYGRVVLVLDQASELTRLPELRSLLLSVQILVGSRQIVPIFISESPWRDVQTCSHPTALVFVRFTSYSRRELARILLKDASVNEVELFAHFVPLFIQYCWETCRDVRELRHLCKSTFEEWMRPVRQRILKPTEKLELIKASKPCLDAARRKVYVRDAPLCRSASRLMNATIGNGDGVGQSITSHSLPRNSKWLVVAAFLASITAPRMDVALFAATKRTGGSGRHKRRRIATSLEDPHPFTLERLLAVYAALRSAQENDDSTMAPSAELLIQVTSLVGRKVLSRVSRPDEISHVRYRCLAPLQLATQVASSLDFDLNAYVVE